MPQHVSGQLDIACDRCDEPDVMDVVLEEIDATFFEVGGGQCVGTFRGYLPKGWCVDLYANFLCPECVDDLEEAEDA